MNMYGPDNIHEVIEKEEHDEPIYDEEYLHVEYGESFEVKRSMQTTIAKEERRVGHDIFHTHCTSQDMTSNDIIDNRRCENVASNYIVEKLKSQSIEHQNPYKLKWPNKDNKVKISQHNIV